MGMCEEQHERKTHACCMTAGQCGCIFDSKRTAGAGFCVTALTLTARTIKTLSRPAHLEDDVLGAGPLAQATSQLHTNHLTNKTATT